MPVTYLNYQDDPMWDELDGFETNSSEDESSEEEMMEDENDENDDENDSENGDENDEDDDGEELEQNPTDDLGRRIRYHQEQRIASGNYNVHNVPFWRARTRTAPREAPMTMNDDFTNEEHDQPTAADAELPANDPTDDLGRRVHYHHEQRIAPGNVNTHNRPFWRARTRPATREAPITMNDYSTNEEDAELPANDPTDDLDRRVHYHREQRIASGNVNMHNRPFWRARTRPNNAAPREVHVTVNDDFTEEDDQPTTVDAELLANDHTDDLGRRIRYHQEQRIASGDAGVKRRPFWRARMPRTRPNTDAPQEVPTDIKDDYITAARHVAPMPLNDIFEHAARRDVAGHNSRHSDADLAPRPISDDQIARNSSSAPEPTSKALNKDSTIETLRLLAVCLNRQAKASQASKPSDIITDNGAPQDKSSDEIVAALSASELPPKEASTPEHKARSEEIIPHQTVSSDDVVAATSAPGLTPKETSTPENEARSEEIIPHRTVYTGDVVTPPTRTRPRRTIDPVLIKKIALIEMGAEFSLARRVRHRASIAATPDWSKRRYTSPTRIALKPTVTREAPFSAPRSPSLVSPVDSDNSERVFPTMPNAAPDAENQTPPASLPAAAIDCANSEKVVPTESKTAPEAENSPPPAPLSSTAIDSAISEAVRPTDASIALEAELSASPTSLSSSAIDSGNSEVVILMKPKAKRETQCDHCGRPSSAWLALWTELRDNFYTYDENHFVQLTLIGWMLVLGSIWYTSELLLGAIFDNYLMDAYFPFIGTTLFWRAISSPYETFSWCFGFLFNWSFGDAAAAEATGFISKRVAHSVIQAVDGFGDEVGWDDGWVPV